MPDVLTIKITVGCSLTVQFTYDGVILPLLWLSVCYLTNKNILSSLVKHNFTTNNHSIN